MNDPKTTALALSVAIGELPSSSWSRVDPPEHAPRTNAELEAEILAASRLNIESQLARIPAHYFRPDAVPVDFKPGLPFVVITGPTDSGKTTAAVGLLAREARRTLEWIRFLYYAEFVADASAFRFNPEELSACIGTGSRRILLLDDLGADLQSSHHTGDAREFGLSATYLLLEKRGARKKKTIITTNTPRVSWPKQFGERIAARLERFGAIYELGDA